MICSSCQRENLSDARFCDGCGVPLVRSCPSCSRELRPGARFCSGCGQAVSAQAEEARPERDPRAYTPKHLADKILQSKSALEGERKQLTVLFADVKGSLALSEGVDLEHWHRILDGFFSVLTDGVHRFEGTVNQYTGDGIMALFGAPIAHEDHAQRACYAALQLREELGRYAREVKRTHGLAFSVRMGIHSGEVVVGKIGDDLRMDYTAQGHTVGLAARMQELASPDTVYLTGDTTALVSGYFDLEDLGAFNLKGVATPVPVFQLRGMGSVRTRFDVSRARGLSRFVGRADDMRTLEAALARVREGNGQVVGVVGEAGVGKSRLCFEFAEHCRAEGLMVLEGRSVAHGKNIPFLPVLQAFRSYYGISEQDSDRSAREKIAGRMLLLDDEYREVLPLLFEFFGVPDPARPAPRMDPEARQRQLFGVLRRLVQTSTQQIVTLIEDLHWIDGGSEAFLEQWVDAVAGTPNLLLVNFRPEYRAEWIQKSWYHQLPLLPLGPEAIRELLDDLLGSDRSLEGLAEAIHARTGGNPFFAEEVVQSLIESGHLAGAKGAYRLATPIERLEVPTTVQSLLAARIDRLPEREKQVLQAAAVIGKEFSEPILEQAAPLPELDLAEALRTLKSAEFIYEQALYPVAEYAFKHPLTQEVALNSQLRARRREIHKSVAKAIEEARADKLDENAALLAHHWEEAGETFLAARWHRRAAEWAGAHDVAEASRHWHRVRELMREVPDVPEAAELGAEACAQILNTGWRLGLSEEEEAAVFAEGKHWTERSGDLEANVRLEEAYGSSRRLAGDFPTSLAHMEEAERLAQQTDNEDLRMALGWGVVYQCYTLGRLSEARARLDQLIQQTREKPDLPWLYGPESLHTLCLWFRANLDFYMGDVREASSMLEQAVQRARERGELENEGWALANFSLMATLAGDVELVLPRCRRSLEIAEKIGSPFSRAWALSMLAGVLIEAGEWQEAVDVAERALQLARERRTALEGEAWHLFRLAEAHLGAGELAPARSFAEESVAVGRRMGVRTQECLAQRTLARVLLRQEGLAAAKAIRRALDRADTLVDETGAKNFKPLIQLERAELARLEGDSRARAHELREAHRLFSEMGATERARYVAAQLESLSA